MCTISSQKLNPEQEQASDFLHGICSVIAVPGSGKTKTMMERIAKLIKQHNVAPESILGLTFTRNAAQEMRNRLATVIGAELSERVMLSTIHGFCHFLLRTEGFLFEVLNGRQQVGLIKESIRRLKHKELNAGMVLREINLAKNNLITASEFRELYAGNDIMQMVADVYERYDREKQKKMVFDFDDLLIQSYNLFLEDEDTRNKYRSIYRHLLIDEFQDTTPAQLEMMKLLVNDTDNGSSFWICGDDWQSVFSFTGASVANILNFKQLFPSAHEYILNINYRSTPQIVSACQNLIEHNIKKIPKILKTINPDGEKVFVLESASSEDEAQSIAKEIKYLTKDKKIEHKNIAVLYRANFQSRVLEEVFASEKIPYHIENGLNFYERSEIRGLLDYLRFLRHANTEKGDKALLKILNVPNRYVSKQFMRELEELAAAKNIHYFNALKSMRIKLPYLRNNIKKLIDIAGPLIKKAKSIEPAEMIQELRTILDYDRYITDEDVPSPDDLKMQNLNQLQVAASKHETIDGFLTFVQNFEFKSASHDENGVALMTIHKSKGLEFSSVFIAGMVDGVFPNKKGDPEEERRICFVGISRAMKYLYLSSSSDFFGKPSKRSPYIDEILKLEDKKISKLERRCKKSHETTIKQSL